jgi:hypothetical protein
VKEVSARSLLLDLLIRALKRPARLVEEIACKISSGDRLVPDLIDLCNFPPRLVREIEHEGKGLRGRHCWWEDNDQLADFLEINNNRRYYGYFDRWTLQKYVSCVHWPCIIARAGIPAGEPNP